MCLFQMAFVIHHLLAEHFIIGGEFVSLVQLFHKIEGNSIHNHETQQRENKQIGFPFTADISIADIVYNSEGNG